MTEQSSRGGGRLVLAATPIGNVQDASPRLVQLLAGADVIAAEDTRRLHRLLAALGVSPRGRVLPHWEHNEQASAAGLVREIQDGGTVLLVTDGGMPAISDPGLRAVRAAVAAGLPVTALPGPSAVLTALALSGLPTDRFCFEGFLPRGEGKRADAIAALAAERRTVVLFESPRRTADTLKELAAALGSDRPAAVCRELTKTYEQVLRGPLAELADWAAGTEVLGEVTLVVGGAGAARDQASAQLLEQVAELIGMGLRHKDAVAWVARAAGVPKKALYDASLPRRAGD